MLDLTIHGDLRAVRHGLDRVSSVMVADGYDADIRGSVEIVLAEVLNNIVKHAYAGREDGRITVKMLDIGSALQFEVSDTGTPLPVKAVRKVEFNFSNTPVEALPEGGFGWQMIRKIATDLDYRRSGDRNWLCFRIPFASADPHTNCEEPVRPRWKISN